MNLKKTAALLALMLFTALLAPAHAEAPPKEISIIFTHDMHAHFDPERAVADGAESERGGYARVQTAFNTIKTVYPDTFVLDAGDFSMGTPYQTIYTTEAPDLRLMGRMGYDAVTLGNHEFDYRAPGLTDMLNAASGSGGTLPSMLIANIDWEKTLNDPKLSENAEKLQAAFESYGSKDYTVIEKGGIRAAVFGIMGTEAVSFAPESGLYFLDPIERSKEIVAQIKADGGYDVIICLSHSGTKKALSKSEDEQLAKSVPDIDLIISGHTHTTLEAPIIHGNTVIASSGQHAYAIGHLTLVKSDGRNKVSSYILLPIDGDIEKDPGIEAEILKYRELVNEEYFSKYGYAFDQVLAATDLNFTPVEEFGHVQGEDTLGNLISDSYIHAVKQAEGDSYREVDAAVVPAGVVRGSFRAGDITVADVFNVSSLGIGADRVPGYPLVSMYLTGKELKTVAEIDISVSTLLLDARLYISGVSYTYNPYRLLLNRVTDVYKSDTNGNLTDLDNDKLYRVVGGLYSCQMMGAVESKSFGLLKVVPKDAGGNPIDNFEEHIINDGGGELKEWVALARYIESFPSENGTPKIPEYYGVTHGRKVEKASLSPIELFKNPNKIFFLLLGAVLLVLAIIIVLTVLIIRRLCRRRNKRTA